MEVSIRKKELNNNLTNLLKKIWQIQFLKIEVPLVLVWKDRQVNVRKIQGGQIRPDWHRMGQIWDISRFWVAILPNLGPYLISMKKAIYVKIFKKKVFWLKWTIWWGYHKNEATMFYVPETEKHYRLLSFILEQWFQHFSTIFTPKSNWSTF